MPDALIKRKSFLYEKQCLPYRATWDCGQRMQKTRKNHRAKAKQASKLAEIREALIAAGCDTTAKQAAVMGVGRSTAWVLLNSDRRAGPSAKVIKRILSSPNLPLLVRRKVEEYIEEKISGLYGHSEPRTRAFRDQMLTLTQQTAKPKRYRPLRADDCHRTDDRTLANG